MAGIRISIIIPTQRRPGPLALAAQSALAQVGVERSEIELVIVDNDALPSAQPVVERLRDGTDIPIVYVHETRPGVAHARNAGMAAARGSLIAFLDDDEEAPGGWLAALLATQARHTADVVFGPVRARVPETARHRAYLARFFSRVGPEAEGPMAGYFGCGNSLVRRAALPDPVAPFALERNHIGGEDDLLFGHMQAAGARFAWAPDAWVHEDPAPSRLTLRYTLLRAFAYGQGPTEHCASSVPPDRLGVVKWMAIGVGQSLVFGAVAALAWITGAPDRAQRLDRAARGLGKTLWFGPFKLSFYGQTT
ncbi:glycosyltransferase family 2 protein [Brevundimonas variabilis]|uniref:Glycosyltransferase involved in cell wall biosynthesis n=1 Tax=Brevundimonas variabilis TaxID=74312 RepID=A0A7W9CH92_9CAUL|nr:glycosyltransferase [Brevundimonas variabilis]MBB5745614.1 glycosyltransferase involved in cell wall biosynthesis [Brevundimonas variabilis]